MDGVRLVAVDLDGTLLRSDLTVSARSRAALAAARDAGSTVIIVTARSPRSVREIARDAGLGGRAICANGATVFDLDAGRIDRHVPLAPEAAARLVAGMRRLVPGIAFGWEHELRFGSEPAYERLREPGWWPRPEGSYPPVDALAWERPMTKLLARLPGADLDELLPRARALAGRDAEVTLTGTAFVEFTAPGVSKQAALAALAGELGVGAAEVVAFGDHVTDVGMLGWAGLGVATANAHPAALEVADVVTLSNDEDGVAVVLERMLRGQSSSSESVGA